MLGLKISFLLSYVGAWFVGGQHTITCFDVIIRFGSFIVIGAHLRGRSTQNALLTLRALLLQGLQSFLHDFLAALFSDINANIKAIIRTVFKLLIF